MKASVGPASSPVSPARRSARRARGSTVQLAGQSVEALVEQYAPLVRRQAALFSARVPPNIEFGDLVQAGMLGLLTAARRHAEAPQPNFEAYMRVCVHGALIEVLRESDWLPRRTRDKARQVEQALAEQQRLLGREPSEAEIAEAMGLAIDEYHELLEAAQGVQVVLYEDIEPSQETYEAEDSILEDTDPGLGLNPADTVLRMRLRDALIEAIGGLPEREQLLLSLQFDHALSQKEIAIVMDLSEGRISQLRNQAILRLRAWLSARGWDPHEPPDSYTGLL